MRLYWHAKLMHNDHIAIATRDNFTHRWISEATYIINPINTEC